MSKDLEDTLQEKVVAADVAAEVMGWVGITRKKF